LCLGDPGVGPTKDSTTSITMSTGASMGGTILSEEL